MNSFLKVFTCHYCGDVWLKTSLGDKEVLICGFLSDHAEAEWRRACGVLPSSFGRLEQYFFLNGCCCDTEGHLRRLVVLCGWSLWLIITIILYMIWRMTDKRQSEEAVMFV